MYDLVIIGAGPAGLTASIYAKRAGLDALLIEKFIPGGQAATTSIVENYPGISPPISGPELMDKMKKQVENLDVEFITDEIMSLEAVAWGLQTPERSKGFKLKGEKNNYEASAIIVASGAANKKLDIPGEKEFTGKGVSYCATCDGPLFKGKEIMVIGGGDMAVEEAIYLTRFATSVTILHRRDRLRTQEVLAKRAKENPKIKFLWNTVLTEICGKDVIEKIKTKDLKTQREAYRSSQGVFIFVGLSPNSLFVKDLVSVDENGFIATNEDMATSKDGIFAAGDVRKKNLRQIVTAASDGAIAAMSAFKYISHLKGTAY